MRRGRRAPQSASRKIEKMKHLWMLLHLRVWTNDKTEKACKKWKLESDVLLLEEKFI
jgi:hypothetical protein